MEQSNDPPDIDGRPENRLYKRTKLYLPGQIFDPASERSVDCKILNLSAGGAAVQCDRSFAPNIVLVLYVENFGRFEGRTIVHADGQLALNFSIGESKRGRLSEMLKSFTLNGVAGVTEMRRHARVPALVSGRIVRASGQIITCDVLDISLEGVSVRTKVRPPVGEIVNLGRTRGRVVRHHEDGFAIQYVREAEKAA
jgi:hypothetical protein